MIYKILVIGAGSPHNNYTGVDGLANSRIPLTKNLSSYITHVAKIAEKVEFSFCNVNYPHDNPSIVNPILEKLGYEDYRHLFTRQMLAKILTPKEAMFSRFDLVIVELRPDTFSFKYHFHEQTKRLKSIVRKQLETRARVILWDMDEWAADWKEELELGAELGVIYYKEPNVNFDANIFHMHSWDPREFSRELDRLDAGIIPGLDTPYDIWYCGNTYGRTDKLKLLDKTLDPRRIAITGNWMRKENVSAGLMSEFEKLSFIGQSDHVFTIPLMHHSIFSFITGNKKHIEHGLIACRVFEAYAAGTPILVDKEYDDYTDAYKSLPNYLRFEDHEDLMASIWELGNKKHFRKMAHVATGDFIMRLGSMVDTYKWVVGE